MEIEFNMGVAEDPRPQEQKERDYTHRKLAGAPVIVWQEKTEWKRYIEREQDGSLSCMAQAGAKAVEILKDKKEEIINTIILEKSKDLYYYISPLLAFFENLSYFYQNKKNITLYIREWEK